MYRSLTNREWKVARLAASNYTAPRGVYWRQSSQCKVSKVLNRMPRYYRLRLTVFQVDTMLLTMRGYVENHWVDEDQKRYLRTAIPKVERVLYSAHRDVTVYVKGFGNNLRLVLDAR